MERHTFAMKINKGKTADFRRNLGKIWPELTVFLDEHGMTNFSIWSVEDIIFGYYETDDDFAFTEEDKKKVAVWKKSTAMLTHGFLHHLGICVLCTMILELCVRVRNLSGIGCLSPS